MCPQKSSPLSLFRKHLVQRSSATTFRKHLVRRSSATTFQIRCSQAVVPSITKCKIFQRLILAFEITLFLIICTLCPLNLLVEARRSTHHYKMTVAEDKMTDPVLPLSSNTKKSASSTVKHESVGKHHQPTAEYSIEDVDEEQIDEFLKDATRNLVVFFYDGRVRCPECTEALAQVEEIDDDIEATGYIEVVKTDDRRVARECGVSTFPALVYFRRKNPILYDGDFHDAQTIWRWIRSHDEVVTWDLNDDNFESRTDSHSPDEGALDWLVMFYDSDDSDCNAFTPIFETVAHRLRGLLNAGRVDKSISDDVTERFRIDDNQCPTFLLLHRGKLYRYNDAAKDVRGLTQFALYKFKEQRGHRVPEPPTALEAIYEHMKEKFTDAFDKGDRQQTLTVLIIGGVLVLMTIILIIKAYRLKQQQKQGQQTQPSDKKSD